MTAYLRLEEQFRQILTIESAADLLYWDQAAIMPSGGWMRRGEQLSTLGVMAHELLTSPQAGGWLEQVDDRTLTPSQRANVSEMRRKRIHAMALTPDLVAALNRVATACGTKWREARAAQDFTMVRPLLTEMVGLSRQAAAAKSQALGVPPYDALMDQYEPGARSADIAAIFDDYIRFLSEFLARVLEHQKRKPAPIEPRGPFPLAAQKALAQRVMDRLGFDFARGRLDESAHPMCMGRGDDVRITTRYREGDALSAQMAVIHETGHAIYEQQLPEDWRLQPVGRTRGVLIDESQALIFEMQAARSPSFCGFLSKLLRDAFPNDDAAFEPDNLYRLQTRVRPSFIRVEADEVTYPAHVAMRFRLERALIAGELEVADLPTAWNEGMRSLLGLEVMNDSQGCLQDAHWYEGAFGYFPFYSLGAMAAAQLFSAAKAACPDIEAEFAEGRFDSLREWLRTTVHSKGSSQSTSEIIVAATGRPLDSAVFKRHLETRYLDGGRSGS